MEIGSLFLLLFWVIGAIFGLGLTVFWIWMLIDAATKEPDQGNDKIVWIIIIALLGWIGAAVYFFVRRPKRITEHREVIEPTGGHGPGRGPASAG